MNLLLNIDTATEEAHVSIAREGLLLDSLHNRSQKDHASFLQVAIQQLVKDTGTSLGQLDAIAVTAGPGSYTGLRVGMASAKGLCYALNKPLITIDTLTVLAASAITTEGIDKGSLLCPMIDARRMEVFTALYDTQLQVIQAPSAMILDSESFAKQLATNKIFFFGSGAEKWEELCTHLNAVFISVPILPVAMATLSAGLYGKQEFADLAHSEPLYLKEFHNNVREL